MTQESIIKFAVATAAIAGLGLIIMLATGVPTPGEFVTGVAMFAVGWITSTMFAE